MIEEETKRQFEKALGMNWSTLVVLFFIVVSILVSRNLLREKEEIPVKTSLEILCESNPNHDECIKMRKYQDYQSDEQDTPPDF